jgi:hypothetical protein
VTWSDGFESFTTNINYNGAGPFTHYLTIPDSAFNPTNVFPNAATNHYYSVTSVSNADTCMGNLPGDITGTDLITVNPRPTATLVTTNTICNGSSTVLEADLTGIGPWTVTWSDGFESFTTNINYNGAGPFTHYLTIPDSAFNPTNVFLNAATNHYYSVTSVSNADTCMGNLPGDITGTDLITVNPRPTATLMSFNTTDCNDGPVYTLTNTLTGLGPWTVLWNDGYSQTTNASLGSSATLIRTVYPTNSFGANVASNNVFFVTAVSNADSCMGNLPGDITGVVTNAINPRPTAALLSFISTDCNEGAVYTLTNTLTGIGPWVVTWNDGLMQTNTSIGAGPVTLLRTVYPTNSFGANMASNNVYYVTGVADGTGCTGDQSGDITGVVTNTINPTPLAPIAPDMGGVATNSAGDILETNVLGGVALLSVAVQTNCSAWWYDWTQANVLTNHSLTYLPTNAICGVYTNYAQAQDTNTGCFSKDYATVILVLVPPAPSNDGDQINCAGVANPPLSVTVFTNFDNPTNLTANWYTDGGTLVTNHSLTYLPTDTAPGTNTYWVEAQDFASGLVSTNRTQVNLILQACTNPPVISFNGTNGTIQWFGNLTLQSTTNLNPPVMWIDLTNPGPFVGTNIWSWTNGVPPINFFRLNTN